MHPDCMELISVQKAIHRCKGYTWGMHAYICTHVYDRRIFIVIRVRVAIPMAIPMIYARGIDI